MSGWRKSIFLSEYLERVHAEGRFATEKKPADKLMKAMTEDCTKTEGWSGDTLQRYLTVGELIKKPAVKSWLIIWEATFKRNAFLDGISLLRACVSVTPVEEELARLMQILYLEQRSGLKKSLKVDAKQSTANLFKAYLIRTQVFKYLEHQMPKLADIPKHYGSIEFFKTQYGLNELGEFIDADRQVKLDDDQDEEEEGGAPADKEDEEDRGEAEDSVVAEICADPDVCQQVHLHRKT